MTNGNRFCSYPSVGVLPTHDPMITDIIHLGVSFWRQLVVTSPNHYFGSGNALLLCLSDEGLLLHHFFLSQDSVSSGPIVIQACVTLAKGIGTSTLVRIQTHPADETAPIRLNSSSSGVLYETARLYDLHLVEIMLRRFTR